MLRVVVVSAGVLLGGGAAIAASQSSGASSAAVAAQAPGGSQSKPAAVDLNTATLAQLETLPGIGPRTAARIKEYREKSGGFKKTEELMKIRGIGEKAYLRIRDLVTVGSKAPGPSTPRPPGPAAA